MQTIGIPEDQMTQILRMVASAKAFARTSTCINMHKLDVCFDAQEVWECGSFKISDCVVPCRVIVEWLRMKPVVTVVLHCKDYGTALYGKYVGTSKSWCIVTHLDASWCILMPQSLGGSRILLVSGRLVTSTDCNSELCPVSVPFQLDTIRCSLVELRSSTWGTSNLMLRQTTAKAPAAMVAWRVGKTERHCGSPWIIDSLQNTYFTIFY